VNPRDLGGIQNYHATSVHRTQLLITKPHLEISYSPKGVIYQEILKPASHIPLVMIFKHSHKHPECTHFHFILMDLYSIVSTILVTV